MFLLKGYLKKVPKEMQSIFDIAEMQKGSCALFQIRSMTNGKIKLEGLFLEASKANEIAEFLKPYYDEAKKSVKA